jgi:hypothetical protein
MLSRLRLGSNGDTGASDMPDYTLNESRHRAGVRGANMKHSRSNPDIANIQVRPRACVIRHVARVQDNRSHGADGQNISQYYKPPPTPVAEHVLKVYRADQTFKYLTVYRDTTAQAVVTLALQEFAMIGGDGEWSLCEVRDGPSHMTD